MRSKDEIRENAFVVARQYLADEGARDRPIAPVYQLHLDMLDLLGVLAEQREQIERDGEVLDRLQAVAEKALDFLILVGEYNSRQPEEWALGTAMAYGRDADQLGDALERVGL